MDGISYDEGHHFWDGRLLFCEKGLLTGDEVVADHKTVWPFGHKARDLPVEIIDVMLGPVNLGAGWAEQAVE